MTYRAPESEHTGNSRSEKTVSSQRKKESRRKKRSSSVLPFIISGIVIIAASIAIIVIISGNHKKDPSDGSMNTSVISSDPSVEPSDYESSENTDSGPDAESTGDPVITSSMTFGSTGDILIHPSVLYAFETEDGHDFTGAFTYVKPYYSNLDLMVANLEVPLVDPDDGYVYSSNPFASPDAVAEALKDAGVDICLTANNHTYDMGNYGLMRTQNVLTSLGLEYTGTRLDPSDSYIISKTVNDICLGMICYTYETGGGPDYRKSLNYIPLSNDDSDLVNTFDYDYLGNFYKDAADQLSEMKSLGCDVSVFYIHWGDEYQDYPNDYQTEIAQTLCDLGVDIIIGGHPHVVQEFDVLTNSEGHQTLCLYSMGNELSNQRREFMNEDDYRGYTEDGVIFTVTIDKYSSGEVKISSADVIPTWVQRDDSFEIIPLDPAREASEWPASDTDMAAESYERTMGRIGDLPSFFE